MSYTLLCLSLPSCTRDRCYQGPQLWLDAFIGVTWKEFQWLARMFLVLNELRLGAGTHEGTKRAESLCAGRRGWKY